MSGLSSGPCGSTPIATAMSWISLLANRRSRSVSQEFSTLPRSGRMAWYSLSRPLSAEPPRTTPPPGRDGLVLLAAPHLRRTPGRIALDEEDLGARHVARFAIGQLARQDGHA